MTPARGLSAQGSSRRRRGGKQSATAGHGRRVAGLSPSPVDFSLKRESTERLGVKVDFSLKRESTGRFFENENRCLLGAATILDPLGGDDI